MLMGGLLLMMLLSRKMLLPTAILMRNLIKNVTTFEYLV
jgi:hypothetical protein